MSIWRRNANRNLFWQRAGQYPLAVWVPRKQSPSPQLYDQYLKEMNAHFSFSCIPVSDEWVIWSFETRGHLDLFLQDLRELQRGVDDGIPHNRK